MMNIQSTINNNSTPITQSTDNELVCQTRDGNDRAFEMIMRRHNQRLYRIARSILREDNEAMDVVQEAYVKAYYHLEQFKGPDGFISWLSRIVRNEAMMRIRKSKRIDYTLDDINSPDLDIESSDLEPLDHIANQQLRALLEEAIDRLDIEYRSVYMMRAIEQMNTAETAEVLELTEDVVKTRYLRAKRTLHKRLTTKLNESKLDVFEFAGENCNNIVQNVMLRITKPTHQ